MDATLSPRPSVLEYTRTALTTKYCTFSGRATRKEYWGYVLCVGIVNIVVQSLLLMCFGQNADGSLQGAGGILSWVVLLALLPPGLALWTRRMHDIGRSFWDILWLLIPLIGAIAMLYFCLKDSTPGTNKYGPSEKYPEA